MNLFPQRFTHTWSTHKVLLFTVSFLLLFSLGSYAVASFTPGQTLDPNCSPGDSGCYVEIATNIGSSIGSGTAGSVLYLGTSGVLAQDNANLFFDSSNIRLGVGTSSPAATIHAVDTTEQMRLGYDSSNYMSVTVGSTGSTTFNLTGTQERVYFDSDVYIGNVASGARKLFFDPGWSQWMQGGGENGELTINNGGGGGWTFRIIQNNATPFFISTSNDIGIGTGAGTVSARLHLTKTTEQLRVGYNTSNYYTTTVSSAGAVTFDAVGSGSAFTFSDNVSLGTNYLTFNTATLRYFSTDDVLAIGPNAGASKVSGDTALNNIYIGKDTGASVTTGDFNILIGSEAGELITTGRNNVILGSLAGGALTTGGSNIFIGTQTGDLTGTGSNNTFVGFTAGTANTSGTANTFFGYRAGLANTTANNNTFIGYDSGVANTTGTFNTFLGGQSGPANTTGTRNVFLGHFSGRGNTSGLDNIAIGYDSGSATTTGGRNLFLGTLAGSNNTEGQRGIFLGYNVQNETATTDDYLNIGNTIFGDMGTNPSTAGSYDAALTIGGSLTLRKTTEQLRVGYDASNYYSTTVSSNGIVSFDAIGTGSTAFNFKDTLYVSKASTTATVVIGDGTNTSATLSLAKTNVGDRSNIFFQGPAGTASIMYDENSHLRITNDGSIYIFDSTGNVGIGTVTDGGYKLDVQANAATYAASIFNDGDLATRSGLRIQSGLDDHTAAGPSTLIGFFDGDGTSVGSITFASSATAYNTTSDQRLKTNIVDTTLSLDTLRNIQVRDFSFIADTEHKTVHGFIAQELYSVYPTAVTKPLDESSSYWMVDYSKLVPLLVKSVQDLDVRIEQLDPITNTSFASRLASFFASSSNGIGDFFAGRVRTQTLCIGQEGNETCLSKQQLDSLLTTMQVQQQTIGIPATYTPVTEEEPTTEEEEVVAEDPIEETPTEEPVEEVVEEPQEEVIEDPVEEEPAPQEEVVEEIPDEESTPESQEAEE